jgi:hypothetical protein
VNKAAGIVGPRNKGRMMKVEDLVILQGLSAGVLVGFVVASIAFGLAAARFISQPEWLRE